MDFLRTFHNDLRLSQRALLVLFSFALVTPMAQFTTLAVAQSEGQNYTGALIAQILGIYAFTKVFGTSAELNRKIWNRFALLSGISYALLRIGCHFRGCCWGGFCALPWAIYYENTSVVTPHLFLPLHPVQLYSALHGVLTFASIRFYLKRHPQKNMLGFYLVLLGAGRLITDQFRDDARFYGHTLWGHEPNIWLALGLVATGLLIANRSNKTAHLRQIDK